MAFGRRKKDVEPEVDGFVDDLDPEDRAAEDALLLAELEREEREQRAAAMARPQGPWDVADAPELENPRLDLGGLLVPVLPDIDVRLEVSPEGEVVAATLVHGESSAQVNAFAAPKTEGIWDEVRAEIREALAGSGGQAEDADGLLGVELRASVPTEVPGQGVVLAPARFVGFDGPRWFLRGLITGPGAVDDAAAAPLLAALKQVAVVRGSDPMAVRDPLPLVLPAEAMQVEPPAEDETGSLQMPERGPEITETR
ncbi:MAG: hypothetical protein JWN87_1959 [Frankiales bacterium]|nr:hypothetical protein [Frankiales bacterium]MCW2584923.1 hypothetical protein [Frankiales bacterium]